MISYIYLSFDSSNSIIYLIYSGYNKIFNLWISYSGGFSCWYIEFWSSTIATILYGKFDIYTNYSMIVVSSRIIYLGKVVTYSGFYSELSTLLWLLVSIYSWFRCPSSVKYSLDSLVSYFLSIYSNCSSTCLLTR